MFLAHSLLQATEQAAIAASRYDGKGQTAKNEADGAAVGEMKKVLNSIPAISEIVIGEGKKDNAPGLFTGETYGSQKNLAFMLKPDYDIAVDPIDGTNLLVEGMKNSLSVIAACKGGGMYRPPENCHYTSKMVYDKEVKKALGGKKMSDLSTEEMIKLLQTVNKTTHPTIAILDRPRHRQIISELKEDFKDQCHVHLFSDGEIAESYGTLKGLYDLLIGVGGTTEAVIIACQAKCLGGEVECRFMSKVNDTEFVPISDSFTSKNLVKGPCCVAISSITYSVILGEGVKRYKGCKNTTSTLLVSKPKTESRITTRHFR